MLHKKTTAASRQAQPCGAMPIVLLFALLCAVLSMSSARDLPAPARVAILTPGLSLTPIHKAIQEGLSSLGYKEGTNITYIVKDTKGFPAGLEAEATKLLASRPNVLVSVTAVHTLAAKAATTTVPIVFAWTNEPVESGLIASFASSRNNLTGVTTLNASLSGKRLEVLLELVPQVKRVLVLITSIPTPNPGQFELAPLEATAKKLAVQLVPRFVSSREDIENALRDIRANSIGAIYFLPAALVRENIDLLISKAKSEKIPLAVHDDLLVERGALFSYGPNARQVGIQTALLVDKVLKGANPSKIVVETPNKLFLTVNLTTAKAIGLRIPGGILERVDRLID